MIPTLLVEDEPLAAAQLKQLLAELAPELQLVGVAASVKEAVQLLRKHAVELIFLDVQLRHELSFAIFDEVHTEAAVILTTAYDQYALRAFRHNSLAYLLKPLDPEELSAALDKFRKHLLPKGLSIDQLKASLQQPSFQERFMVSMGSKIKSIPVNDIACFVADGRYVALFDRAGHKYLIDQRLDQLEEKVDPKQFFRISRQCLLAWSAIEEVVVWSQTRLKVVLCCTLPDELLVSIDRQREFKAWLDR
jgi:DNA-binding LytR/AlgR family response regulator